MTTLKTFAIAANGTPFGEWTAETADAAILAYVQDAGFKTVAQPQHWISRSRNSSVTSVSRKSTCSQLSRSSGYTKTHLR